MNPRMPPLPEVPDTVAGYKASYVRDQLLSAQRAAWNAAMEAAAEACEREESSEPSEYADGNNAACSNIASAIRSLKEPDPS